ncbi:hypothetical protein ACFLW6_00990 [Chloroflexota bacterium]
MSMFGREYELQPPPSLDAIKLRAGDIVYISGDIWGRQVAGLKKICRQA